RLKSLDPLADRGHRARRLVSQRPGDRELRVPAAVSLEIGAAGQRGMNPYHHLARSGRWDRKLPKGEGADGLQVRLLHGVPSLTMGQRLWLSCKSYVYAGVTGFPLACRARFARRTASDPLRWPAARRGLR